uniref:30S ribosomal protein S9 n=1 Tax=Setaria digitata TaxID=48799 RepID=A0A915Q4Y7_9BILA
MPEANTELNTVYANGKRAQIGTNTKTRRNTNRKVTGVRRAVAEG